MSRVKDIVGALACIVLVACAFFVTDGRIEDVRG